MSTVTAPSNNTRTELTILEKLDKKVAGDLTISTAEGGASFHTMAEVLEFSKLMSVSQQAVPKHCRNAPGVCLGIVIQAIEWRMSPYAVANKSYVVSDRISYESQLIHAVIEQRAPISCRLRHRFIGEGKKRQCVVWATAKGEADPLEYTSPEFDKITPKNSPLWVSKPDLQLFYNASRDWARMYFPDVILGVYAEDELDIVPGSQAIDRPRGIEGLKQQLTRTEDQAVEPAVDQQPFEADMTEAELQDHSTVDQRTPEDDANQDPYTGTAPSPEEIAEIEQREREELASGRGRKQKPLLDTGGNEVGQ